MERHSKMNFYRRELEFENRGIFLAVPKKVGLKGLIQKPAD